MALTDRSVDLDVFAADVPERVALVMGTEGQGLTPAAIAAADTTVRIPMHHGVDSLNVAAASAVGLWAVAAAQRARH
jgi:tRNA G18 (ribose-2'-O)-methylase SpoU